MRRCYVRRYGIAAGPLHVTWRDLWTHTWCFEIAWNTTTVQDLARRTLNHNHRKEHQ